MTQKSAQKDAARARQAAVGGSYAAHRRIVDRPPPSPPSWRCDVCRAPIKDREGFITVVDPKFDDDLPELSRPEEAVAMGDLDIEGYLARKVKFDAYHRNCAPAFDYSSPYFIQVEEASSLEAWCSWVKHVGKKTWMKNHDVTDMLSFWFENRGRQLRG